MGDTIKARGSCLCGAVTVEAETMSTHVGACHCGMCRKWTGGPGLAVECGDRVNITGEENITVFDSSDWAERAFCSKCGTHLYYRLKQANLYHIQAGLFDAGSELKFDHQIFIEEKPGWYDFANKTKNLTGEEVFKQFAGLV
ncbi:MAG: GFA family protein [Gammaproteobacteria bacterium]|nr:GFA family protein [Gammaproteobacteria bacterium]